jgi:hypothetical protein
MYELINRFSDIALAEVHRYEGTINQFLVCRVTFKCDCGAVISRTVETAPGESG